MNTTCFTFSTAPPGQPSWVSNPSCRGTFNIVSLCLSTTVICIWSSVHRDIPLKRLSPIYSVLRDAPLVLVALFAPELLFYFALNQFLCARDLVRTASELDSFNMAYGGQNGSASKIQTVVDYIKGGQWSLEEQDDDIELLRSDPQVNEKYRHPFTLVHGFYASMGGLSFPYIDQAGVSGRRRAKLTSKGVRFLMKHAPDLIPDLSERSITDRSSSNGLGKALSIVQVAWFCLNCVTRLEEQLPLSLLELSTLAHGLFTLSSYAMWWFKPLNIKEPTWIPIDGVSERCKRAREVLALLLVLHETERDGQQASEFDSLCAAILHDHESESPSPPTRGRVALALDAVTRYGISDLTNSRERIWELSSCISLDTVPRFRDLFYDTGSSTVQAFMEARSVPTWFLRAFPSSTACCIFSVGNFNFHRKSKGRYGARHP